MPDRLPLPENFNRNHVARWLGEVALSQGECLHEVSPLEIASGYFSARVGDTGRFFHVQVRFSKDSPEKTPENRCTCPAGRSCGHVAAALLFLLGEKEKPAVSPDVLSWITDLRHLSLAVEKNKEKAPVREKSRIFYALIQGEEETLIQPLKGSRPDRARPWMLTEEALISPPRFLEEDDLPILRQLLSNARPLSHRKGFPISLKKSADLLEKLLASHRFVAGYPLAALTQGLPRQASFVLKNIPPPIVSARQALAGRLPPKNAPGLEGLHLEAWPKIDFIIPLEPFWYLDLEAAQLGLLETPFPPGRMREILSMPPMKSGEASQFLESLKDAVSGASHLNIPCLLVDTPPCGELRLASLPLEGFYGWRDYPEEGPRHLMHYFDYAEAFLCYGDVRLPFDDHREYAVSSEGRPVRVKRDHDAEKKLRGQMEGAGFKPVPDYVFDSPKRRPDKIYGLSSEAAWDHFMSRSQDNAAGRGVQEIQGVQGLEQAGWRVSFDRAFRHYALEAESWEADVSESKDGWLNLDMGVVAEGRRFSLAPMLADLFRRDSRWLDVFSLADISPDEPITLLAEDETRFKVPAERLKPLARLLIDLFDGYREGKLRLSRLDAPRLDILRDKARWQFHCPESVMELAKRLKESEGMQEVAPPKNFRLELRNYQKTGLSWLQYLREHQLAGILADDMGLGKTAQVLAHLLLEKEMGRLDRPALVVLPTSLIFNWKNEAHRFAPDLKVLSLHGLDRKALFQDIPFYDVVLTTYPLLWRDSAGLQQYEYHFLILDEAQMVKNSRAKSASVVRQIKTRHRLCLTGTPLENHLGEIWAQFDFLLPGFLGDVKNFGRVWRNPIEKQGDTLRRELLSRRLRPFILRRKKDDVVAELPPKTIIIRTVELSGAQRDLYETVRAAMDAKVRAEIANRGFKRSQIVILDALLKLRQVCCDPRLVKSEVAHKVRECAKLDMLMDMLPELVDEGRRILVFSQFTAMLALIQERLRAIGLDYVLLTGETKDRAQPVKDFQEGKAPLFLISLKAGGVGLNLTAADTVIHYDPWWNPAVENQATDRAHRLGQDKPVFVYKLIVAGSIEEKILALQEQKAELAAGILSEQYQGEVKFGDADIASLFDPLPDFVRREIPEQPLEAKRPSNV